MFGRIPFLKTQGTKKARIEIIPLIDVIFFLLATFVLFTLSLNRSGGLPVSLPASDTAKDRDAAGATTLTVTADGTLAWDKTAVTLDEFILRLRALHEADPKAVVLINGDEKAKFGQVRYVVDEARKAGLTKVLVETRIRPSGA